MEPPEIEPNVNGIRTYADPPVKGTSVPVSAAVGFVVYRARYQTVGAVALTPFRKRLRIVVSE
jgi:hypothetical protein